MLGAQHIRHLRGQKKYRPGRPGDPKYLNMMESVDVQLEGAPRTTPKEDMVRCIAGVYQQLVGSRYILYDCSDSVRSRYPNFPQGWTSGNLLTSHRSAAAAGRCVPLLHRSARFGAAIFTVTVRALLRPIPGGGGGSMRTERWKRAGGRRRAAS